MLADHAKALARGRQKMRARHDVEPLRHEALDVSHHLLAVVEHEQRRPSGSERVTDFSGGGVVIAATTRQRHPKRARDRGDHVVRRASLGERDEPDAACVVGRVKNRVALREACLSAPTGSHQRDHARVTEGLGKRDELLLAPEERRRGLADVRGWRALRPFGSRLSLDAAELLAARAEHAARRLLDPSRDLRRRRDVEALEIDRHLVCRRVALLGILRRGTEHDRVHFFRDGRSVDARRRDHAGANLVRRCLVVASREKALARERLPQDHAGRVDVRSSVDGRAGASARGTCRRACP